MNYFIFDVDDTLYDQQKPFQNAVNQLIPNLQQQVNPAELYKKFRFHSDEIFSYYSSGKWSLDYMRYIRFKKTFEAYLTPTEALAQSFQNEYQNELSSIALEPETTAMLNMLKNQPLVLGIITNGPAEHQAKKIQQLALEKWFPAENIFISGAVGSEKPQRQIFDIAAEKLKAGNKDTIFYIGDSFENDIVGSNQAGWKNIWFNHRRREVPHEHAVIKPDYVVESFAELTKTVQKLAKHTLH